MGSLGHKSLKLVQVSQDHIWPVRIVQHIPFVRSCFWNVLQYWKKQMNNYTKKKCLAHNPWYSSNYGHLNTQKSSFFGTISLVPNVCVCVCLKVQEMPQLGPFHVSLRLWSGKPREDWVESWNLKPTKLDAKGIKYPSLWSFNRG